MSRFLESSTKADGHSHLYLPWNSFGRSGCELYCVKPQCNLHKDDPSGNNEDGYVEGAGGEDEAEVSSCALGDIHTEQL